MATATVEKTNAAAVQQAAQPPAVKPKIEMAARGVSIQSVDDVYRMAKLAHIAGFVPKELNSEEKITVAMLYLHEIGAPIMRGLQRVYIVNNRPTIYGDLPLGMVQADPSFDFTRFREWFEGEGDDLVAFCQMARKGGEPIEKHFSMETAKTSGLVERNPQYKKFPEDMLMWKARHRCMTALFSNLLSGINTRESLEDEGPIDVAAHVVSSSRPVDQDAMPRRKAEARLGEIAAQEGASEASTDSTAMIDKCVEHFRPAAIDYGVSPERLRKIVETMECDHDAIRDALATEGQPA